MRSNAEAALLAAALALGACSHGALPDAPVVTPEQNYLAADPSADPGVSYAPPGALPPAAPDAPPAMPPPRYDNVGYAGWTDGAGGVSAAHRGLPPGSYAEVTSLDTGKTIVVPIDAVARSGREIELSGAAAQQLGLAPGMRGGVRVRAINPGADDVAALRAGQPATARPDTPPVLLNPLRRKLGGLPAPRATPRLPQPVATPRAPKPPPRVAPPLAPAAGYYVQVAALSDPARANALARSLGGAVVAGGGLYRVRTGPYGDERQAQQARDGIVRRGYGEARIVRPD